MIRRSSSTSASDGARPGLVRQVVPEPLERPQRLGLAARQVQGPHQQLHEPLPQRLFGDQPLQVDHRVAVAAALDQLLRPLLLGQQPQLVQAGRDRPQPPLVAVVAERPPRPQAQRRVVHGDRVVTAQPACLGQQRLEHGRVVGPPRRASRTYPLSRVTRCSAPITARSRDT